MCHCRCPGFWVDDIAGCLYRVSACFLASLPCLCSAFATDRSCQYTSVPPVCTQAYFWNLWRLPPQVAQLFVWCPRANHMCCRAVFCSSAAMTMRTHTQRCGLHWQPFIAVPRDCDLTLLQLCPKLDYKGADGADDPAVPSCLLWPPGFPVAPPLHSCAPCTALRRRRRDGFGSCMRELGAASPNSFGICDCLLGASVQCFLRQRRFALAWPAFLAFAARSCVPPRRAQQHAWHCHCFFQAARWSAASQLCLRVRGRIDAKQLPWCCA